MTSANSAIAAQKSLSSTSVTSVVFIFYFKVPWHRRLLYIYLPQLQ